MVKVLIAENIPSLNKGEVSILEGIFESIKPLGDPEISMFSDYPDEDRVRYSGKVKIISTLNTFYTFGFESKIYRLMSSMFTFLAHFIVAFTYRIFGNRIINSIKSDLWKSYFLCDVIIIGHDGSYGAMGTRGAPPHMYHYYLPFFAKLIKKPIVIYAGEIKQDKTQKGLALLSKLALNQIDLITLRESKSYENIKNLGIRNDNVYVTADLAFLFDPSSSSDVIADFIKREGIDVSADMLIGMTVTKKRASIAFPELSPDDSYRRHNIMMAKIIDIIIEKYNATIIFFPHCIGFGEELDDRIPANDIARYVYNKGRVKVIMNEYPADVLKSFMRSIDLFVGERVHSTINAISVAVPTIIITNKNDIRIGIFEMAGQKSTVFYIENIGKGNELQSMIEEQISNRKMISENLKVKLTSVKEKAMLNGKYLKDLLINIKFGMQNKQLE